ncbi:hypothetical protein BHE74_00056281 [Ensete ventricosum]|nr:hypothetical protein BHE74_00056281 [Ensete ventricosum]
MTTLSSFAFVVVNAKTTTSRQKEPRRSTRLHLAHASIVTLPWREEMRGASKLALGAALTVAVSLALVFTLLLVLLVDLFCSLLCCRSRRCETTTTRSPGLSSAAASAAEKMEPPPPPFSTAFGFPGVLQAPTSFLLSIPKLEAAAAMPPTSERVDCHFSMATPSPGMRRISSASSDSTSADHFVRISNPIYDGVGGRPTTPFETPGASPSHFGFEEDEAECSPALTAMRKLPPMRRTASFVGLRSAAATSVSAAETYTVSVSSSSDSSPSW